MQLFPGRMVLKGNIFLVLLAILGCCFVTPPARSQALLPHTLQLNSADLRQQGLSLAQEADRLGRVQQYDYALPRAKLATQLAPKQFETWAILGQLYLQTDEVEKGISAFTMARTLAPENPNILFALGSASFQQKEYRAAVDYLLSGLKIEPDIPGALFDLGNAYYMLRDFQKAIAQYEKAIAKDETFWPAINNIGLVRYEQGKVKEAQRRWQASLNIDETAAEPMLAIAVALYTEGKIAQAYSLGESALSSDPRYGDLEFLRENLWGDRLLADTKKFLETPRIKATLAGDR